MHIKLSFDLTPGDIASRDLPISRDRPIYDEVVPHPALRLRHSGARTWVVRSGLTGNRKRWSMPSPCPSSMPAICRRQQMKAAHPTILKDSKAGQRDVPLGASAPLYQGPSQGLERGSGPCVSPSPAIPLRGRAQVWNAAKQQAGLPSDLRIRDLRHSFASHAIMAGESLFTVSRLLRHSRVQTTARYAHLADHAPLDSGEKIGRVILAQAVPPAPRSLRRDSGWRNSLTSAPAPFCEDTHAIQLHGGGQHGDRRGS